MKTISYTLSDLESKRVEEFIGKCQAEALAEQKASMSKEDFEFYTMGGMSPYAGAIGGSFSYIITNTSIGAAISIRDNRSGKEEDITDYDNW